MLCGQVSFGVCSFVNLHGKGRKERTVPIWPATARVLRRWFQKQSAQDESLAFPTIRGTALSADGLDDLLQRAVGKAKLKCPALQKKRVTPHVVRRTTAMHLLQAGVDISSGIIEFMRPFLLFPNVNPGRAATIFQVEDLMAQRAQTEQVLQDCPCLSTQTG